MIVKRDWPENRVLGMHLIADGSMSRHVIVPASGTVQHPTDACRLLTVASSSGWLSLRR